MLRGRCAAIVGLLGLFALGLQALSTTTAPPGMHGEEELYNAAHALVVRDGGWDLVSSFRYQDECGGCAVVAGLGAALFSWVQPSLGAWRSIGLLFFALGLAAGLALGWKVARFRGAAAIALVFAAAPPAYQRLAMIVNGNHSEGGSLLLVEVALAAAAATAATPLRRGVYFGLLLLAVSAGVPFLFSLQLGLVLPFLVLLLASGSRWERFALWPGLLVGGSVVGLLPYGALLASMAHQGVGSHESGHLVLSTSFIGRNLWTLIAPTQVQGIWGAIDGPLEGRLGWFSFAAICVLLLLGMAHCIGELRRTRTLSLPARVFVFPATTVVGFVVLYLLYERQIGSGSGPPGPGQIRYLGLIYPTALCSAALAAALAGQREGWRRIAAGFLLVALLLPGAWTRLTDARFLHSEGAQALTRYAPASAYGVDVIERLGVPLDRAPVVGRLDLAGMSLGRAAVRDGVAPGPIKDERAKEAWVFGALRELMESGFNSARGPADLLAKIRPAATGGPSEDVLAALGVDEPRQGGANSLDRWLLRNIWTFQRNTLRLVHQGWDEESLTKLLAPPSENSSGGPRDPYGLVLRVSAAALGVEAGPLATRSSERLVVLPGAVPLWKGAAPPPHLLEAWAWAWAWGFGAELGFRKGPGVRLFDLSVDIPSSTLLADDSWVVLASALEQGFAEGYSYGSWLDWVGPRDATSPQVNVALFGAGEVLFSSYPLEPKEAPLLPSFRPESSAPQAGRSDSVLGGNGLEWRDLRGGSPRDFPGEGSFLGDVSELSFCRLASGRSCVPLLDEPESCAAAVARSEVGQTAAVSVPLDWMSNVLSCRPSDAPFPDFPQDVSHALSLGAQLLVGPSLEAVGGKAAFPPESLSCAEEGLAALARGLGRLGQDIGRELYLQSSPLLPESQTGLEVARLPVHLVDLPQSLSSARAHLLAAALRSRGRRAVTSLGANVSSSPAPSSLVDHLVWGGAVKIEGQRLPRGVSDLLAFSAEHRDLIGMAEAPLGVVLSLTAWADLSESDRIELLERSEVLLEELARAGVPYQLVVFGMEYRGPSPVETVTLALQGFDHLVIPQAALSAVERSALTALAEGKPGQLGFLGPSVAPLSGPSSLRRWETPKEVVQSMRQAGLGVRLSLPEGTASSSAAVHVSRHVVARDGGVAFHLVPQGPGSVSLGLSIPKRLFPRAGIDWWFHHPEGKKKLLSSPSNVEAQTAVELSLPRFSDWGILEARPSRGVGGSPDLKIIGSRERTVFISVWDDPEDEELALIFPENLSPWPIDHSGFEWTVDSVGRAADFVWPVRPVSVAGNIHIVGDRLDLEVTFTNHSSETFTKVYSGLCLAPNSEKGFPGRFHERSWVMGPGGLRSLADLRTSSGASPLHVETNQFSWPVVIEESVARDRSMAIAFDRASGVGGNAWGASVCLHIRPTLEQLEPGASATLRGAVYFVDGPVDAAVSRLEREGWGGSTRRFGPVPDADSFVDGFPPRRPPVCIGGDEPLTDGQ